jgi:hypothetical protein
MGTIHTSVAVVLKFTDSVLEKPATSNMVGISVKQGNKVVWKDSSCAVILKAHETDGLDISFNGGIYRSFEFYADLKDKKEPVIYNIWLTPSGKYPFTQDMTVIRGESTDKEIYLARISKSQTIKLIGDTDDKNLIRIWGIEGTVEEKRLLIKEDDKSEIVILTDKSEEDKDCYYTKDKIKNVYHKGIAVIYPITKVMTGKDGKYIMAYKNMLPDETVEILS